MSLFIRKQKVFISHKRINGTASPEAVLLKQLLDENLFLDTFLDIHEDTLGEFPVSLCEKINAAESFIFLIPSDGNVSFLYNHEGWVYREIDSATYRYLTEPCNDIEPLFQILPITFSKSFEWPDDLPRGIRAIRIDPCRLNLNDKPEETKTKLAKALNIQTRRRIIWWRVSISAILFVLVTLFGIKLIKHIVDDRVNENRIAFVKSSVEGRIATKTQPSFIIPVDERTPLEDSIYKFFELRDQFYHKMKTLPTINYKMVNDDKFSINSLDNVLDAYIKDLAFSQALRIYCKNIMNSICNPSINIDTTDVSKLIIGAYQFMVYKDKLKEMNNQLDYLLVISDKDLNRYKSIGNQVKKNMEAGRRKKALKYIARLVDDYISWHNTDQTTIFFEDIAKICNMYLTGPRSDILMEK